MAENDTSNNMEELAVFIYTSNLQRQDIPRDVTHIRVDHTVQVLPLWALSKLTLLATIELPMGFCIIGKNALLGCTSLQELVLPPSTKEIRAGCLAGCMTLKSVRLNQGLEGIMDSVFQHCRSLTHISIPPSVNTLGNLAFHGCLKLCLVNLPEGLQFLGRSVFMQCSSLLRIFVPYTVSYIGAYCFKDCFQLQSIELPPTGLQIIRVEAFRRCTNLRNISISPETVLEGGYDKVFDYDSLLFSEEEDNIPDLDMDLDPEFWETGDIMEGSSSRTPNTKKPLSIQNRYQNLPIHQLCYYQAHWSSLAELEGGMKSIEEQMEHLIHCHDEETLSAKFDQAINNVPSTQQDHTLMTPLHILALSAKPNFALWKLVHRAFPPGDLLTKDKWGKEPLQYLLGCSIEDDSSIESIMQHAITARLQYRLEFVGEQWRRDFLQHIHCLPMDTSAKRRCSVNQILTILCKYERMEALSLLDSAVWKAQWQWIVESEFAPQAMTTSTEENFELPSKIKSSDDLTTNGHSKDCKMAREICRLQCRSELVVSNVMQFLDPLLEFTLKDPIARF